jgi:hypothetical protein
MDTHPSIEQEWHLYRAALYPDEDEATLAELRRTFYAGALVFETLVLRIASENGMLPVPKGPAHRFLGLIAPVREELHGVMAGFARESDGR